MASVHLTWTASSQRGTLRCAFASILLGLFVSPALAQPDTAALMAEARSASSQIHQENEAGLYQDAAHRAESALKHLTPLLSPEFLLDLHLELGRALHALGRDHDAEVQLRLALYRDNGGSAVPRVREAVLELSEIDLADGRLLEADSLANEAIFGADSLNGGEPVFHARVLLQAANTDSATGFTHVSTWRLLQMQSLLDAQPDTAQVRHLRFLCTAGLVANFIKTQDDASLAPLWSKLNQQAQTPEERRQARMLALQSERDHLLLAGNYAAAIEKTEALAAAASDPGATRASHYMQAQRVLDLAQTYFTAHDDVRAARNFLEAIRQDRLAFSADFLLMNEEQRHEFAARATDLVAKYLSFCISQPAARTDLRNEAYSLVLWRKNLVTESLRAQATQVAMDKDPRTQQLSADLDDQRAELAQMMRSDPANPQIASRRQRIEAEERQLTAAVEMHGYRPGSGLDQVLEQLALQDAAVEIVSFPFWDRAGLTNRTVYYALVVRAGKDRSVQMILLGDSSIIEDDQAKLHAITRTVSTENDFAAYQSVPWRKLEDAVTSARRIYISPDGVLNASPYLLWKHSDGKFLISHKEIDLRPVFSTAELGKPTHTEQRSAILIGDPDFDLGDGEQAETKASARTASTTWRDLIGGRAGRLPATDREVHEIRSALLKQSFTVPDALLGAAATKEALLSVEHPYVLHIATHGFYLHSNTLGMEADPVGLQAMLQHSGLLLAGANRTMADSGPAFAASDGIVTAVEIAGMKLSGTSLAVLSACDSGLGQRALAGGSLGLTRAFHIAGVDQVLVSLWEVDDSTTADLMKLFYEKWTSGLERHTALRDAAEAIREDPKHASPYYWAPFVLYGN